MEEEFNTLHEKNNLETMGLFSDVHAGASYEVGIKTILVCLSIFAPVPACWGPEMRNVPSWGGFFLLRLLSINLANETGRHEQIPWKKESVLELVRA